MTYSFGDYELDTRLFELRCAGTLHPLEPQVFDVLRYLVEHRNRVVTKDELFEQVWQGRIVSDSTLNNRIMAARKAVGDSGREQRMIKTLHGRGFRFVAPVEEVSRDTMASGSSPLQPIPRHRDASLEKLSFSIPPLASSGGPAPRDRHVMSYSGAGSRSLLAVGRDAEIGLLYAWLEEVLKREKRRVVFVTGETGAGKTTLVESFLHEIRGGDGVWIGHGQCVNYRGVGEAYLPVLEAFGRICRGPGGKAVIDILAQHAPSWLVQMPGLVSKEAVVALKQSIVGSSGERMMREMVEALEVLTTTKPLILVLEDLHWSDYATLDLIARLAGRQEPARLFLLGTYRPADALWEKHALYALRHQLGLHDQCVELSVRLLDVSAVGEYLKARFPSQDIPEGLAALIHERTEGNPLFLVQLVEYWIREGWLTSMEGRWRLEAPIDGLWIGVPESLKQLVEQQLQHLAPEDRAILEAASVAGTSFSAAAVAAAVELSDEEAEDRCATLARRGQFLHAGGIANWQDGTVATRFSFIHHLYQEVLYERVPAGRKRLYHHRIGSRLESAFGSSVRERASELIVHFVRGNDRPQAVKYLQWAAEQALSRSALKEAAEHLQAALDMLADLPETPERDRSELEVQALLGSTLVKMHGWSSSEAELAFLRARVLSEQLDGQPQLLPILYELAVLYEFRGEYEASQELMNYRLKLSRDDFLPEAHELLACSTFYQGRFSRSLGHAKEGLTAYKAGPQPTAPGFWGHDSGILCRDWAALALWFLGYPDQARRQADKALALAQHSGQLGSLSNVQMKTAILYHCLLDAEKTAEHAATTIALGTRQGFAYRVGAGMMLEGWATTLLGETDTAMHRIQKGLDLHEATGANMDRPYFLGLLADACLQAGRAEEGLLALSEALAMVERSRGFFFEAELHRLRGLSLLRSAADTSEAEACFTRAHEVAGRQHARSLQLRAATSLAGQWNQQGRRQEALDIVIPLYEWFSEGLDTHDLRDAATLLDALGQHTGATTPPLRGLSRPT